MDDELYTKVHTLIAEGNLDDAQQVLDGIEDKDARWHYLSSHVYLAKNWTNESRKQLEIAIELDPENEEYKEELEALKKRVEEAQRKFEKGNKKKHLGKGFINDCMPECGEAFGLCCGELCCQLCCTAVCEGCGG